MRSSLIGPEGIEDEFLELLKRNGIGGVEKNTNIRELNNKLQEQWRVGKFSHEIGGEPLDEHSWYSLDFLGYTSAVHPPHGDYQGALLCGALVNGVRARLAHLVDEYLQTGGLVDVRTVYLLGSDRPRHEEKESREVLSTPVPELPFRPGWILPAVLPFTELEIMQMIIEQSMIPLNWKIVPILGKRRKDGLPADMRHTVRAFQETNPEGGHYLLASSLPYLYHQVMVAQTEVAGDIKIVGMSPKPHIDLPKSRYLDAVAKEVYELAKMAG